jgi:hypothetical protein
MRPTRPLLVAGALVLAVGIGTTVALTTAASPTEQPAASPAAAAPGGPPASPAATTATAPRTKDSSNSTDGAEAATATPAPRILEVTTSPRLRSLEGGFWLEVPPGAGTVVVSVKATHTQRVRFVLTPTGTETGPYGRLLGEDRDPGDGFSLVWRYPTSSSRRIWASRRSDRVVAPTSCSASPTAVAEAEGRDDLFQTPPSGRGWGPYGPPPPGGPLPHPPRAPRSWHQRWWFILGRILVVLILHVGGIVLALTLAVLILTAVQP